MTTDTTEAAKGGESRTKDLLACPLCGGDAELGETEGADFYIACGDCGASVFDDMKWSEDNYDGEQNVIKKWNKRAHHWKEIPTISGYFSEEELTG